MPTVPQKISKETWEELKPTIKRLHIDQGLPVKSKIGRRSLTKVMKDEHNFNATHYQYEAQFRKWGWVKNLSNAEWNLVLPVYHWLKEQHIDVQVKVSGRVLEKSRLERARRHIGIRFDGSLDPPTTWLSMSDYCHIAIETRGVTGEWSRYPPRNCSEDISGIDFNPDLGILPDVGLVLPDPPTQEEHMNFGNGDPIEAPASAPEMMGAFPIHMADSWLSTREQLFDNTIGLQLSDSQLVVQPPNSNEISSNGFTGISEIPASSVVKLLRSEPQLYETMHKFLQAAPDLLAKPFAENLLKASVEGADAEAVRVIADTMSKRGVKIDPNELVCESDGDSLTPAELAGKHRSVELLQILLRLGADPNKTVEKNTNRVHGALAWALDVENINGVIVEGEIEPSFALVSMLVDAGAKVKATILDDTSHWCADSRILALMIKRVITDDDHVETLNILHRLIENLDNDMGIHATQTLFQAWKVDGCQCGKAAHPATSRYVQKALNEAIIRQNLELCQLILSRTVPEYGALVLAIGKGNRRIASLLIQHGSCVSEIHGVERHKFREAGFTTSTSGTTPLGEAIRRQDPSMLQFVEEQGAWAFVAEIAHAESVAVAAAEVGDMTVLERLFAMDVVREHDPSPNFEDALEAAARNEDIAVLQMLLDKGARPHGAILEIALKAKNSGLVRMILDSGIVFSCNSDEDITLRLDPLPFEDYRCALELAIEWGNMEIIQELIDAKAHCSIPHQGSRALCAATRSGNVVLVDLLLSAGVRIDSSFQCAVRKTDMVQHVSPLSTAVKRENTGMVRHLIQKGADPANALALRLAIELDNGPLLSTLLAAFRETYPAGRSDFGADILITAITKEGSPYLEELLEAKMNINHLSSSHGRTPLGTAVERHESIYMKIAGRLLESGADPNAIARVDRDRSAQLPPKTALLIAIETGNEEMVELLLKNGADVNREARGGVTRTPLQSACQRRSLPIVQLLLRWDADVNAPPSSRDGGTALQLACLSGSIKIVRHLLSVGANVFGPTSAANGRSALENAAENGRLDVIKVLWDATGSRGFEATEVARAQRFARSRGFPGCAEYIAKLSQASFLTL
ncbi:unnamed protein product [Clonostachys rosea]|uniref:Clr5 domain-containing protein n=1 Tax=Bionectria ochroleuca TaxID=29856 RepID=A0ABY6UI45_BIOOC|nr:unnamed protein product [Clonostachys rosea]